MTFKFPLYQNAIEQSFLIKYNWFSFSSHTYFSEGIYVLYFCLPGKYKSGHNLLTSAPKTAPDHYFNPLI